MKLLSYLLIIIGAICFGIVAYYLWLRTDPNRLAFTNYDYANFIPFQTNNPPRKVIIKDLGINLNIIPAEIKDGKWDTTQDGASYLITSPIPGDDGNSILYAHNWASLFGPLLDAKPGEEVEIDYKDGTSKKFVIEYTSVVNPDQSSILAASMDKRITLYTCTGWFDAKRFVVVAIFKK